MSVAVVVWWYHTIPYTTTSLLVLLSLTFTTMRTQAACERPRSLTVEKENFHIDLDSIPVNIPLF